MGRIPLLFLLCILCGCVTVKMYPGPELPENMVAVVEGGPDSDPFHSTGAAQIVQVDGKTVATAYVYEDDSKVAVEPGVHNFDVRARRLGTPLFALATGGYREVIVKLQFRVEAGHHYRIFAKPSSSTQYVVWVEDMQTKEVVSGQRP